MKSPRLLIGTLLLLTLFSCSDSSNPAPMVSDIFIPNLSNQWTSSRGTNFFFTADNPGTNKSTFTGSEQDGENNTVLTGNYENYTVQFTFDVSKVTYTGKFIKGSSPLRMELKGSDGKSLTITQQLVNNN